VHQFYSLLLAVKQAQAQLVDNTLEDFYILNKLCNKANHMNKKEKIHSMLSDVNDLDHDNEKLKTISSRRSALAKIGKFSAYAVPTALAIVSSKPASASGEPV
jgi:hypothetical protein